MKKIAILGAGNLGLSIAKGVVEKKLYTEKDITLTRRKLKGLDSFEKQGYNITKSNKLAVEGADYIFLCVQPKQLDEVAKEIKSYIVDGQVLVSVIAGVQTPYIQKLFNRKIHVLRAMPNTAIAIGESMTCLCYSDQVPDDIVKSVKDIFSSLGEVMAIEERLMKSATVLGASGIAFFMRYLRAATQGGIQMGFHPEEAQKIAVQTARGAAGLILQHDSHPEIEIDKVTTPEGCTIAGLNEMEHRGFSSALIKGLTTSLDKINIVSS